MAIPLHIALLDLNSKSIEGTPYALPSMTLVIVAQCFSRMIRNLGVQHLDLTVLVLGSLGDPL
jgi:hypothetical protein